MHVFLTGITGFLGSHVVAGLLRQHHQVTALVRPGADLNHLRDLPVTFLEGSLSDLPFLKEALRGCQAVIHAAARTHMWPQRFRDFEETNLTGTRHLCTAAIHNRVSRFVYVGTANAIGYGTESQPGTELDLFNLHHIGSGYINSKFLAQQYVLEQVEREGLPALVVNPTFLIGPQSYRLGSGSIIPGFLSRSVMFCPPGVKNFLDVRDAASSIINALAVGKVGECYLLAGQNLTYRDFFKQLRPFQRRKSFLLPIGKSWLYGLATLSELWHLVTGNPLALNLPNARMLCLKGYYDSGSKARRELGFSITPLHQTLADAVAWYRNK